GAARDVHLPVAGRLPGTRERPVEPVDERERRVAEAERLARVVRQHEHRNVEGRVVAPPAVRVRVVRPRPLAAAEHLPAHDDRADAGDVGLDKPGIGVVFPALAAVAIAEGLRRDEPIVQLLAALAERLLERRIRAGDVAVQRDRDVGKTWHAVKTPVCPGTHRSMRSRGGSPWTTRKPSRSYRRRAGLRSSTPSRTGTPRASASAITCSTSAVPMPRPRAPSISTSSSSQR